MSSPLKSGYLPLFFRNLMTLPRGLHHVEINVSNLERSRSFWEWLLRRLGYSKFQHWKSGESWKLDDTYIVLVQTRPEHLEIQYNRCQTGLNHLAFHANSRQQVDELTRELRRRKIRILYENKHPFAGGENYYAVYFEDPDRIKVEVVAPGKADLNRRFACSKRSVRRWG